MAKYSKKLDQSYIDMVMEQASKTALLSYGIRVEAIKLLSKKSIGEVMKGNDLVQLFANNDSLIVIAINEDVFDMVDEDTQKYWIENLLAQVYYDSEKDKIIVQKPEMNINIGMYHKYGQEAIDKAELAIMTLQQIADKEREMKEQLKVEKTEKKSKKKY